MKQPHEILEALTKKGYSPTLLYAEGCWLVSDAGVGQVDRVGERIVFTDSNDTWSENIADAVLAYLKETGEEV